MSNKSCIYFCHECQMNFETKNRTNECDNCYGNFIEKVPRGCKIDSESDEFEEYDQVYKYGKCRNNCKKTKFQNLNFTIKKPIKNSTANNTGSIGYDDPRNFDLSDSRSDTVFPTYYIPEPDITYTVTESQMDAFCSIDFSRLSLTANCSICINLVNQIEDQLSQLHCRHVFHRSCLKSWLERKQECPMCRQHVNMNQVTTGKFGYANAVRNGLPSID